MIKALVTAGGRPLVILGLSGENMARLMAKEPILLDLADLGLPSLNVVILGGKTEDEIADDLRTQGLIPPEATP